MSHNIVIDVPKDIIIGLLRTWLSMRDVARLDTAMLNRADREFWLQMIDGELITTATVNVREKEMLKLQWMNLRNVRSNKLAFRGVKFRDSLPSEKLDSFSNTLSEGLKSLRFKDRANMATPLMMKFITHTTKLEELMIQARPAITGTELRQIGDSCSRLKTFTLMDIPLISDIDFGYFASKCANIAELHFENVVFPVKSMQHILSHMKLLTKFVLKSCVLHDPECAMDDEGEVSMVHTRLIFFDCSQTKLLGPVLLPYIVQRCPFIERLNLSFCSLAEDHLRVVGRYCGRVRSIFVPGNDLRDEILTSIISKCPLTDTIVLGFSPHLSDNICIAMAKYLPNLKTFALWANQRAFTEESMRIFVNGCKKLDKIALTHTTIEDNVMSVLVKSCKITRMEINGCQLLTSSWMPILSQNCAETLTHFVAELVRLSDEACFELAKCTKLEYLNLSHNVMLTNEGLKRVVDSCSRLSVLKLKDCAWVTDDTLTMLANDAHYLRELDITRNVNVTAAGVLYMMENSKRLHRLHAASCFKADPAILNAIQKRATHRRAHCSL